ncbi:MAG: 2-oxo acid dehydrogenase subunit E2 [Flavobacteriaceae bacterium]|nr:2-oxo acid dehydrogenase subunit E2 [Flavobacteriaceae bacterium]
MAEVIRMPKMSDTMTEGVIVAWNKKVGDTVKPGDILADVETDKATMELENFVKGTLLHIGIQKGQAVPVDSIIAIIGKEGEDISSLLREAPKETAVKTELASSSPAPAASPVATATPVASVSTDGRLIASPLAKKMAADKGIDLHGVSGSGEGGRIVRRDVESFVPGQKAAASMPGDESYEDQPLSQMRKAIARRLSESMYAAPHFYLTMKIDMGEAVAVRKKLNETGSVKISMNDLVVKAVTRALLKNPKVNSSWLGDKIRINHHIHIGVAMAMEEGLVVPVLRHADKMSLSQISIGVKTFAEKAKNKKLLPEEFSGNTFTISNLGMFGIEEFTAIINPPDSCILAVGAVAEMPMVKNGQVVPGHEMKVTMSCDHRSVDGAVGSAFLQTLKLLLEDPVMMLM